MVFGSALLSASPCFFISSIGLRDFLVGHIHALVFRGLGCSLRSIIFVTAIPSAVLRAAFQFLAFATACADVPDREASHALAPTT